VHEHRGLVGDAEDDGPVGPSGMDFFRPRRAPNTCGAVYKRWRERLFFASARLYAS
jgi:hypothetical protein